jgi:hypothetical protein
VKLFLFQFADEAAAIADPVAGAYHYPGFPADGVPPYWDGSVTFPNESVRASQVQQSGFWLIVAADLDPQHPACRVAWDSESGAVLGGSLTSADLAALYVEPVPAGAVLPWSGAA